MLLKKAKKESCINTKARKSIHIASRFFISFDQLNFLFFNFSHTNLRVSKDSFKNETKEKKEFQINDRFIPVVESKMWALYFLNSPNC